MRSALRQIFSLVLMLSLLTSTMPASAQSFGDIIGSNKADAEARARRINPASAADSLRAKALVSRLSDVQRAIQGLPPPTSSEVYEPANRKRAAELKAALDLALREYDVASFALERFGTPLDAAVLAQLRDAVAPFVRYLDRLRQAQKVSGLRPLLVPPGEVRSFDLSAYCMDSGLPAPKQGETFRLIPAAKLMPAEMAPLLTALMNGAANHSYETQGLIWALRNAYKSGSPITLDEATIRRLASVYPEAPSAIQSYNTRVNTAKAVRGLIDAFLPNARSLVSQVAALDPRRTVEDTRQRLAELERMPVAGNIDQDAAYTTIATDVAVRTTSPWGGASRARVEIANASETDYVFKPAEWVAASPRNIQHLALQVPAGFTVDPRADGPTLPLPTLLSAGLDMSALGNIKAALQAITGRDLLTGEETNRWLELASIIPVVGQLGRAARMASRAETLAKDFDKLVAPRLRGPPLSKPVHTVEPVGWAEHRKLFSSSEEAISDYRKLYSESNPSPWPSGYAPKKQTLKPGDRFEMALSPTQPSNRPGMFGTTDRIADVPYVREKLAVRPDWKPQVDRSVTYEVVKPMPVLTGPVGPQVAKGPDGSVVAYLPGGGSQIQFDVPRNTQMEYLKVVPGAERKLK